MEHWNGTSLPQKNCLNEKAQKSIVACTINCQKKNSVLNNGTENEKKEPREMELDSPEMHQPWKPPAHCNAGPEMMQFSEATMHSFFHGLTKNIILEVQNWASL